MVQSSLATKSQSFDLVKSEIEQTIKQAESSLERFQENRERGEDLQNCVDFINQLRGIFILVELRGGILLCQEAVTMANDVPVGLTGWAQINGWRGETDSDEKMAKRVEYDLEYVRNWSLMLDLRIIAKTVMAGFIGRNAY